VSLVGLLLVDKPEGPTSHDVTARVRAALGVRRIGHTGTLDPFASGLLILCVGWATRLAEYLTALPKSYRAAVRLGVSTDTDDRSGAVIARSDGWQSVGEEELRAALRAQLGTIEQVPPAYSAKKLGGRRSYARARSGEPLALRAERVVISRLELLEYAPPSVSFEIDCSSGTYVRAVARDLGAALGVGGHLLGLRRVRIGDFRVEDALCADDETPGDQLAAALLPPESAVRHLRRADLGATAGRALLRGQEVEWEEVEGAGPVAVFVADRLWAVAEPRGARLRPKKVFPAAA
jgi:tRNA pseudouridine55 synthase